MDKRTYYGLVSIVFTIIAILHATRLYYGWEAVLGGVDIPLWVSWVAVVLAGYLAMRGWMFVQKRSR